MTVPVLLYMLISCITAVVVPWLGVIFYYLLAVSQAQSLWPWHFGIDSRASLYISLAVIVGLGVATATRQVDWRRLFALPNLALMLVVVLWNLSIATSPYIEFVDLKVAALSSADQADILNKMVVIYFVAVLLIDTRFKLVTMITVVAAVFFYYAYWANMLYVTGEIWRFGDNGRLNGPLGVYHDENYLAMLFLFATPLFYYLSVATSSKIVRYGLWVCILASWHGLFLTGSRGALVALAITCLFIFVRSYSKFASMAGAAALVAAIVFQGGNLLDRVANTGTKQAERDFHFIYGNEDSPEIDAKALDPRLISWQVGLKIMADHPVKGIGAGNFLRAFPEYDASQPHVAHNTFVQVGAACGIFGALVYLYMFFLRFRNMIGKPDPEKKYRHGHKRDYLDDLINALFIAFYSVALFLDLFIYEVTYFVFLCGTCKYLLDRPKKHSVRSLIESIYRWKQGDEEVAPVPQSVLSASGPVTAYGGPVTAASDGPVTVYASSFAENQVPGSIHANAIHVTEEQEQQKEEGDEPPVSQYAPTNLYANRR